MLKKSSEAEAYARLAWENRKGMDFTAIERVRMPSLLHRVLTERANVPTQSTPVPYVEWDQFANWDAYDKSLTGRRTMAKMQRRLRERGNVSIRVIEAVEELQDLTTWMLRHKEVWLKARGGGSPWLGTKGYEEFLLSICSVKQSGHMIGFALLLDDRQIAVKTCAVGKSYLICLNDADDVEFRPLSPQHMLTISIMQWAYERRLNVNFGWGGEPYKKVYLPLDASVVDYKIVNSPFGRLHEVLRSTKDVLKNAARRLKNGRLKPQPLMALKNFRADIQVCMGRLI